MAREKILFVKFDKPPKITDRQFKCEDKGVTILDKDNQTILTLYDHKIKYPFQLENKVVCQIQTSKRYIEITIEDGYVWNGADIPKFLWSLVGSQYNPEFKIPSMIHDYMLEFKEQIYYRYITDDITVAEYRRLTSLIFREALKVAGVKTIKSNFMSWTVQMYQTLFNRKGWDI